MDKTNLFISELWALSSGGLGRTQEDCGTMGSRSERKGSGHGVFILEVSKSSIYKRGEKETPRTGLEGTLVVLLQTQSLPSSVLGMSLITDEVF